MTLGNGIALLMNGLEIIREVFGSSHRVFVCFDFNSWLSRNVMLLIVVAVMVIVCWCSR